MRLYTFSNKYLSSIQHGIQALHCLGDIVKNYDSVSSKKKMLFDWLENHETVICLNGGDNTNMIAIGELLLDPDNPFPWGLFREEGMGGMLTCIGIILPEYIYKADLDPLSKVGPNLNQWEFKIASRIATMRTAN